MLMQHDNMTHGRCPIAAPVAKRLASHVATLPHSRQRCSIVMEVAETDLGSKSKALKALLSIILVVKNRDPYIGLL